MDLLLALCGFVVILQVPQTLVAADNENCDTSRTIQVIASKSIQAGTDYQVHVKSDHKFPRNVAVQIFSCLKSNGTSDPCRIAGRYVARKTVDVKGNQSAVLTINIATLSETLDYFLDAVVATRTGPLIFREPPVKLTVVSRRSLVLIQFSKPTYKPGDIVGYHILIVDDRLLPVGSPIDVFVKNPNGTIVQQELTQAPTFSRHPGFVKGKYTLSQHAALGQWTIDVKVDGQMETRTFVVAHYVLPPFVVSVHPPTFVQAQNATFNVSSIAMRGMYQPTDIQFTLTVTGPNNKSKTYTEPEGKGLVSFTVPTAGLTGSFCDRPGPVPVVGSINASITANDTITGRTQSTWSAFPFYCDPFVIHVEHLLLFQPGLPYRMTVQIRDHEGKPCPDCGNRLVVTISYSSEPGPTQTLPSTPIVDQHVKMLEHKHQVEIKSVPPISAQRMDVVLKLGLVSQHLTIYGSLPSPAGRYMTVDWLETATSETDREMIARFKLNCTESCDDVEYAIINSHGDIAQSGRKTVSQRLANEAEHHLEFRLASESMAPLSTLVVYYYHCQELVAAATEFTVDGFVRNMVELTVRPEMRREFVRPGQKPREKAVVEVRTKPGSLVGTLALDERLLRLGNSRSLTNDDIVQEILLLNKQRHEQTASTIKRSDASDVFQKAGLISINILSAADDIGPVTGLHGKTRRGPKPTYDGDFDLTLAEEGHLTELSSERVDFNDISSGEVITSEVVPDAITTWKFFAFSLHNETGLGFSIPAALKVLQELFVEMDAPYSMIRNETCTVNFLVIHHLREAENVRLDIKLRYLDDSATTIYVHNVPADIANLASGTFWKFSVPIRPTVIGKILVQTEAHILRGTTPQYTDKMTRVIEVRSEGVKKERTSEIYTVSAGRPIEIPVDVSFLPNMVPGSLVLQYVVYGGSWAPVVRTLTVADEFEGLIQLPGGCGEQNMALLMPNIFIVKYLTRLNLISNNHKPRHEKLRGHILIGYERQFGFQLDDYSFSAWGKQEPYVPGSTWLTAFVLRGFCLAEQYVSKPKNTDKSFRFLESRQAANGSFIEQGFLVEREKAGNALQGTMLTAFAVLSYAECGKTGPVTERAKAYLISALPNIQNNPYTLAIVTYALAKLGSTREAKSAAKRLIEIGISENGRTHWTDNRKEDPVSAKTVEGTAYAVLALEELKMYGDSDAAVAWLLAFPRNTQGGYISTQDTVVALTALSVVAGRSATQEALNLALDITYHTPQKSETTSDTMSRAKIVVYDPQYIPSDTTKVSVRAFGTGQALARLHYFYYEKAKEAGADQFSIRHQWMKSHVYKGMRTLKVDCSYNGPETGLNGQINLEIQALSGFQFVDDVEKLLTGTANVSNVDYRDKSSYVVISFPQLDRTTKSFKFDLKYADGDTVDFQPQPIKIYSSYEPKTCGIYYYSWQ